MSPAVVMSLTAMEWGIAKYREIGDGTPPSTLLVSFYNTADAFELFSGKKLSGMPYIVPCPGLPDNVWMLTGPNGVVFSNP